MNSRSVWAGGSLYKRCAALLVFGVLFSGALAAQEKADPEQEYVKKFLEHYPRVENPPALAAYATQARYDELYMGDNLENALKKANNDQGGIAWGLSYRMMSLNGMYRATHDTKYLDANLKCIQTVFSVTDDKLGKTLWNGRVVKAWGSEKYAERGRAIFAVHTGIINAPILDFLRLAQTDPAYKAGLGEEFNKILENAAAALAEHDRQWRDGPGANEGFYIGLDQENACEGKPLPGNRLSAMGWALWYSWKVTEAEGHGNTVHRDRALALGRYIKNRLTLAPDGAYYWPYWLPLEPVEPGKPKESVSGEDTSHAGLTKALLLALAADGEVLTPDDLVHLGKTVVNGFAHRTDGILISQITGQFKLTPAYLGEPATWLPLAKSVPEVRDRIIAFYLNFRPEPSPLGIAQLLLP